MAMSINTTPLTGQSRLAEQQSLTRTQKSLSSGQQINSAADNPAEAAIVQQFAAQIAGSNQAVRNLNDGVSLTQVADGSLAQLQDNTTRLRELAVAAGNGSLSAADRNALQQEADQLQQANRAVVEQSNFNGTALLQGGASLSLQAGANAGDTIRLDAGNLAAQSGSGGLASVAGGIDLRSVAGATQALADLDQDGQTLSDNRARFGAAANGLTAAIGNLQTRSDNLSAARSRVNDTDYAAATAQQAQDLIRNQANLAMQAQANASAGQVLGLLR